MRETVGRGRAMPDFVRALDATIAAELCNRRRERLITLRLLLANAHRQNKLKSM